MLWSEFGTLFAFLRGQFGTPVQCESEFRQLVEVVSDLYPQNILEIGVEKGGTLPFWQAVVEDEGLIVGVDTQVSKVVVSLNPAPVVELLEGDSHDPSMVAKIKELVPEVDFLFIDGDHRYEGVKADYDNFRPLVRPGGIVAFHDIYDEGPSRFWNELEKCSNSARFHQKSGGIGIGVVYL